MNKSKEISLCIDPDFSSDNKISDTDPESSNLSDCGTTECRSSKRKRAEKGFASTGFLSVTNGSKLKSKKSKVGSYAESNSSYVTSNGIAEEGKSIPSSVDSPNFLGFEGDNPSNILKLKLGSSEF